MFKAEFVVLDRLDAVPAMSASYAGYEVTAGSCTACAGLRMVMYNEGSAVSGICCASFSMGARLKVRSFVRKLLVSLMFAVCVWSDVFAVAKSSSWQSFCCEYECAGRAFSTS